jgi:hypothetical protein
LFDLSTDIGETRDLSSDLPGLADSLKTKLYQWLKSVDPMMHTHNPEHFKKQSLKDNL